MKTEEKENESVPFAPIASFFCALRFLTVIPVRWAAERDGRLFPQSIYAFPLIGLLLSSIGVLICWLFSMILPGNVTAFFVVMYLSAISGFLHLDGLADSADGLLSARPRERSLEIMKDSRTGAMGVVILVLVLLGKYSALSSIPVEKVFLAVFCMPLAGRTAILFTMALHRYARQEGGLGGLFYSSRTRYAAVGSLALLVLAVWIAGGIGTVTVVLGVTAFTVFWFGSFCRTRLGGVTGDTLGAVCELTEMSVAIGLTAIF